MAGLAVTKETNGESMKPNKKCVVVLSGGPDSTVVAYWAKRHGYDLNCLSFRYGQIKPNVREQLPKHWMPPSK
jgi:7-cyano-7-deazaguanine synthase in queuosine biosynthesis